MGCPIAMCRSIVQMIAPLVIVARAPQSSCMGFVIDCGGRAARVASYTGPYLAKSFTPTKAASAAIAFYQKINHFDYKPTQSPAVCVARSAAMRKFGLINTKNRKDPFEWDQVVDFAVAYGVRHQRYCHLLVATMAVVMFGVMCRYDEVSR
jgi:hypothetical protein